MKFRLALFILLASLLSACNLTLAEDVTPPPDYVPPTPMPTLVLVPPQTPNAANGERIYAEKCAPCHGETGLGDGEKGQQLGVTVKAFGLPEVARHASPEEYFTVVTRGNMERLMPPFNSLTDQERWDVVAYISTLHTTPEQVELGKKLFDPVSKVTPRELSGDDIRDLICDFMLAAVRAKRAGFDGVQLHAAHGYLLSSFLSPHTNGRTDHWGGPVEDRAGVLVNILMGIKPAGGRDFPVIVKLNSTDFLDDGLTLDDAVRIAGLLETAGIDGIEVSGGMAEAGRGSVWPGLRSRDEEGYFVENAARIKRAVGVPGFGLGGIRTLAVAERIVEESRADLISLSRPLIRDPCLVKRFREGAAAGSECISCNKCFNPRGIRCAELTKTR